MCTYKLGCVLILWQLAYLWRLWIRKAVACGAFGAAFPLHLFASGACGAAICPTPFSSARPGHMRHRKAKSSPNPAADQPTSPRRAWVGCGGPPFGVSSPAPPEHRVTFFYSARPATGPSSLRTRGMTCAAARSRPRRRLRLRCCEPHLSACRARRSPAPWRFGLG